MKRFILYDGRAAGEGTDEAAVLDTARSEQEARREGAVTWRGYYAVWFEYDVDGDKLVNENIRIDLPPYCDQIT